MVEKNWERMRVFNAFLLCFKNSIVPPPLKLLHKKDKKRGENAFKMLLQEEGFDGCISCLVHSTYITKTGHIVIISAKISQDSSKNWIL